MSRIGILTFWGVDNQGTFAQSYALQRRLEEIYPKCEVFQIGYLHEKHIDFYKQFYHNNCLNPVESKRRSLVFSECYKRIPHIKIDNVEQLEKEEFDLLVLGSDIIWDYMMDVFGHDQHLFGVGMNAKIKTSYAPSFGTCIPGKPIPNYVRRGLNDLDKISVRDEKSAEIVENNIGVKPLVVLDPVWLWDFKKDRNIKKVDATNYIFVYGSNFSDAFKQQLTRYAKNKKKELIALETFSSDFSWCDQTISPSEKNPFDVISYFIHADYVATNTYHGMMFSLMFNKKVAYEKTPFVMAKISSLLEYLNLQILLEDNNIADVYEYEWNYTEIMNKIELLRIQSLNFLKNLME